MRRLIAGLGLAAGLLIGQAGGALAGSPVVKTTIWLDGAVVRTLVPPAASPQEGTDPFFMVPGTGGVAGVGPGDPGYHGGHWKVYVVSWNVGQYPLTTYAAIMTAHAAGDISIARNGAADFLCPIQGN